MDLSLDGAYAYPGVHVGSHTLNGWLVERTTQDRWHRRTPSFLQRRRPGRPDPAEVGVTAPATGATVFGVVAVAATASDNVGVYGVQFKLDGAPSASRTVRPYTSTGTRPAAATARTR